MMTVLSLCDFTGEWSRPYREAGYDVRQIDLKRGQDVRLFEALPHPVRGVLAAPPCTEFAASGARWWKGKGEAALLDGLAVVDACLRVVAVHRPRWWCLENPVGRLRTYLGEPRLMFDPYEYGGYVEGEDAYTKRTCLWGDFTPPAKRKNATPPQDHNATHNSPARRFPSRMHLLPPSLDRAALRSVTPAGFARAFFEANP